MFGLISLFTLIQDYFFLLGYVSNYNLFPEPLNAKEEKEYLEKFSKRR